MTYEVHFDRVPKWYSDHKPDVTSFDYPEAALNHARQCLRSPTGERVPYYLLRIHDTATDEWLTTAQLDFRINGGMVLR